MVPQRDRPLYRPGTVIVLALLVGASACGGGDGEVDGGEEEESMAAPDARIESEYNVGRYRITDVQVRQNDEGYHDIVTLVTNTGEAVTPPVLGVHFLRGGDTIGWAEGYFWDPDEDARTVIGPGESEPVEFYGPRIDPVWDGLEFYIEAGDP